jgi:hypothetical protein
MATGAVVGFVFGILVGAVTGLPLAPEIFLLLGVLVGWVSHA